MTGIAIPINKPIVGDNAFAHEAGIHQDGVLKHKQTYEIMTPESIGIPGNRLVMGKHSGRHAFDERLKHLGFNLSKEDMNRAFVRFKELADKKKNVYDEDIEAIVAEEILRVPGRPDKFELLYMNVNSSSDGFPRRRSRCASTARKSRIMPRATAWSTPVIKSSRKSPARSPSSCVTRSMRSPAAPMLKEKFPA